MEGPNMKEMSKPENSRKKSDINIVIANGYDRVVRAVKELLEPENEIRVIGQSNNSSDTLSIVKELNPDVLVLGLMTSEWDSLDLARQVGDSSAATSIVFISVYNDDYYRDEAMKAGVKEYVALSEVGTKLAHAIRLAANLGPDGH